MPPIITAPDRPRRFSRAGARDSRAAGQASGRQPPWRAALRRPGLGPGARGRRSRAGRQAGGLQGLHFLEADAADPLGQVFERQEAASPLALFDDDAGRARPHAAHGFELVDGGGVDVQRVGRRGGQRATGHHQPARQRLACRLAPGRRLARRRARRGAGRPRPPQPAAAHQRPSGSACATRHGIVQKRIHAVLLGCVSDGPVDPPRSHLARPGVRRGGRCTQTSTRATTRGKSATSGRANSARIPIRQSVHRASAR